MSSFQNIRFRNNIYFQRQFQINRQIKEKELINKENRLKKKYKRELKRQAELLRQEELLRQAELLRQEELLRQIEIQRQIEIRRQEELRSNERIMSITQINIRRESLYDIFDNIFDSNNLEFENNDNYRRETIDKDTFNELNNIKYNSENNDMCPICYEKFNTGENVILLNCNHNFHKDCVEKWLCECSNTCPLCKYKIN
tara:strand:- start:176 stop:775 length:600 start_codon:yes stop_codon:yes gene_type:complete